MPIEVRQMQIISNVIQSENNGKQENISAQELDKIKEDILEECKYYLKEILEEVQER